MKAAVVQSRHHATVEENLDAARRHLADAAARGAELALLPEYWFLPPGDASASDAGARMRAAAAREIELKEFLAAESRATGMIVAGNTLTTSGDDLLNVLRVADAGRIQWTQPKLHPMPNEASWGVAGGPKLVVHATRGMRMGGLVCADVLYPEAARIVALQGAEVVLNPVLSRLRTPDPTKAAREAVFVARAWDGACFVLKSSGYLPQKIAGRSLIAAPWGVLARYGDEAADEVLVADLDLDALRAFRKEQRGFDGRRPEAYGRLTDR